MSPPNGDAPPPAIDVGLRRVPELDPSAPLPDSDPRLVGRIADEIRASGPMTFARFMELALYDPEAGYYTAAGSGSSLGPGSSPGSGSSLGSGSLGRGRNGDFLTAPEPGSLGPGRSGDFLTAPEGHPIFGWALARHLESLWEALDRPDPFVVREHGAGSGALAAGILEGLRRSGSPLLEATRYQALDVSPARLESLATRLAGEGLDRHLQPPDDRPAPGAILANELLDALPVHRVEGGPDGQLLERFVTLADALEGPAFGTELGPPSTPQLGARLAGEGIHLEPGQPAEICLAVDGWIAAATAPLERGELLLIDYGHPAANLYRPDRGSTLRAYHRHRVHADPLVAVGRQDLTAHVDLTAVDRAARAAGLEPLGQARQAEFLAALGLGELLVALQSGSGATLESYLEARSAVVRMLDPRATGAFAVLAFGRGLPDGTRLAGFD